jgi:hypothetical protein
MFLRKDRGDNVSLYSIRYAQHANDLIRVGHDEVLRWYISLDGEKWIPVDDHTLKSALDYAPSCLHRASEKCSEKLEWKLDKSTQAKVLGEYPPVHKSEHGVGPLSSAWQRNTAVASQSTACFAAAAAAP